MKARFLLGAWLIGAAACAVAAPFAYLPNDQHQLQVIDLATGTIGARIQLPGTQPIGIAIRQSGDRAYVVDPAANFVTVVNLANNSIVTTIVAVCTTPFQPGFPGINPSGTVLVVPCSGTSSNPGTEVVLVNTSSNSVSARLTTGSGPITAMWNPSGTRFYVSNAIAGTISVFDAATNSLVQTVDAQGVFGIALNPSGTRLYAAKTQALNASVTRGIEVIDTSSGSIITTIPVADDSIWLALNPAGTRLYVPLPNSGSVAIFDTSTNALAATIAAPQPAVALPSPDGTRIYVETGSTSDLLVFDANTRALLYTIDYATNAGFLGNFVSAGPASTSANTPGALSGQWWNHNESGWGIHFTERGNNVFAAWYTYDTSGNPKWYVSTCVKSTASACSGTIFQVSGPRFFGVPFNSGAVSSLGVGTLSVTFNGTDAGTMSYSVNGSSRTVAIERQPLQANGTPPAINYTDIWWGGSSESGWGMALTQQFSTMFMAWYVYSDTGQPVWYVATITLNASGNGGSGTLFRTTGPPFGPSFNPTAVQSFAVGSATLTFTDGNNGTLSYTVNGVSGSKTITRQLF